MSFGAVKQIRQRTDFSEGYGRYRCIHGVVMPAWIDEQEVIEGQIRLGYPH